MYSETKSKLCIAPFDKSLGGQVLVQGHNVYYSYQRVHDDITIIVVE